MKIILDLSPLQSKTSKNRGIGRYTNNLATHILKQTTDDVSILLSAAQEEPPVIQEQFKSIFTYKSIADTTDKKANYYKEQIINQDADLLHIFSPFEETDEIIDLPHDFSSLSHVKIFTIIYDLIPLIFKEQYLKDEAVKKNYYKRVRLLYESDMLLAISQHTKNDAIDYLGINEDQIITIGSAIDTTRFYPLTPAQKAQAKPILKTHGITDSFLLYTGGIDQRKNIDGLLRAYAKLEKSLIKTHQLLIACAITQEQKKQFLDFSKSVGIPDQRVIFTGYISDSTLNIFYNLTKLFVFPSLYEGFGLPLLEAMHCFAPSIASNTSSLPEILAKPEYTFDPTDPDAIAKSITKFLTNAAAQESMRNYLHKRSKEFSWHKVAQKTLEAYNYPATKQKPKKKRLALFSPLPPLKSGISDYTAELIPFLLCYYEIDIFIDTGYTTTDDFIRYNCNIFTYNAFESKKETYDTILYQFGNSAYHAYMYPIALKHQGIIVLHDFFISGLIDFMATKASNRTIFTEALNYSHPSMPHPYKKEQNSYTLDILKVIDMLPLNKRLIESASTIILHSHYAKSLFSKYDITPPNTVCINQLIKIPSKAKLTQKQNAKKARNFAQETCIIAAFGHISVTKEYTLIIQAMQEADLFKTHDIHLIFVGEFSCTAYKEQVMTLIRQHKLQDNITITGFVSQTLYQEYLLATDIAINLRTASRGETSRALLMNMAYALPTIVNDYASFREFPDDTVAKIPSGAKERLTATLKTLITQSNKRDQLAANAYTYVQHHHNPTKIAQDYYQCMEH